MKTAPVFLYMNCFGNEDPNNIINIGGTLTAIQRAVDLRRRERLGGKRFLKAEATGRRILHSLLF